MIILNLSVPMPWLHENRSLNKEQIQATQEHDYSTTVHPITGVSARYCLFDKLHEGNTKQEIEVLRRTEHVPELNGIINTESEEQLHNAMGRDRYFMNSMNAVRHIFYLDLMLIKGILVSIRLLLNTCVKHYTAQQLLTILDEL